MQLAFVARGTTMIKGIALAATGLPLILATYLYFGLFDMSEPGLQLIQRFMWIDGIQAEYFVAVDGLSLALVWLTSLLLFIGVPASFGITKAQKSYYALLLLLEVGIFGVFVAQDYFLFYVFWEIMLLPMYFLIGVWGGPRREYAAIKFFLYTLAGSVLMLIAIVALRIDMGALGSDAPFSIPAMQEMAQAGRLTGERLPFGGHLIGMQFTTWVFWFLFIGFAIKVPVFPFHTWLPDAHVQAPTPISVILAGILLKLGGYGLMRACFPIVPDAMYAFGIPLAALGVIAIVYGAYVALGQSDFKKLVAYSSVSHMGFVVLGFAAMTAWGMTGAALQMFTHGISSASCFLIVGVIYDRAHHRDLNGFGGIGQVMPKYWALATLAFFTSLGLPGLAGFVSEAMTVFGSYKSTVGWTPEQIANGGYHWGWMQTLVLISTIGIVMTAAYILWALQRIFLGPLNEKYKDYKDINLREVLSLAPLLILCVVLGVAPHYVLDWMDVSVNQLVGLLQPKV
ncbi:MAG: NADH-quinone oxidoreductase subunit M [Pseudomonadota bacterium]